LPVQGAPRRPGNDPDRGVRMTFVVIGENIHTTRVVRRPGPRVVDDSVAFVDEAGEARYLPVPDEERRTQEYEEGRVKHVRSAVRLMLRGEEIGADYLRAMALEQV